MMIRTEKRLRAGALTWMHGLTLTSGWPRWPKQAQRSRSRRFRRITLRLIAIESRCTAEDR